MATVQPLADGDDEMLLDDSKLYASQASAAGVSLTVWTGMPHVFQSSHGRLLAAERSLDAIGKCLRSRLSDSHTS